MNRGAWQLLYTNRKWEGGGVRETPGWWWMHSSPCGIFPSGQTSKIPVWSTNPRMPCDVSDTTRSETGERGGRIMGGRGQNGRMWGDAGGKDGTDGLRVQNHSAGDLVNCGSTLTTAENRGNLNIRFQGWLETWTEQVESSEEQTNQPTPHHPRLQFFLLFYNTCMYKYCVCILYCYFTRFPDGQRREKQRGKKGKRRHVQFYTQ